jgi:hypothetical protein
MSKIVWLKTVMGPVTPAMVSGWAPNTEKMNAAMKDARRTSETPYWPVLSMRSRENAMPGKTLASYDRTGEADERRTHFAKNIKAVAGMTR